MKMTVTKRCISFFTVVVFIVSPANRHLYAQTVKEKLDNYFSVQNKKEPLNGVIIIQKKGKTLFEEAFGYASVEYSVKNSPGTKFPIGSITKPFIATSILLLEQKHLLSVNDKINKYLPEVPGGWQDISIGQLLSHTSGIAEYFSQAGYDTLIHVETTNSELLRKIISVPLQFKPGNSYEYSNSNYVLLTCIIERITGLAIDSFIHKEICQPLGLKNTFFPDSRVPVKALATGYQWQQKLYKAEHINFSNLSGAGGIISTAGDVSIFINAMMTLKILPKAVVNQMITPIQNNEYGYGWMNQPFNHSRLIGHIGRIDGYCAYMWYEPKEETSVVYLSNVHNGNFSVISNVFNILLNSSDSPNYKVYDEIPPVLPYQVAMSSLDDYTGAYRFRNDILRITKENNKLYIKADSETGRTEMIPYDAYRFWVGGPAHIVVSFIRDKPKQKISKAEILINGVLMVAPKE